MRLSGAEPTADADATNEGATKYIMALLEKESTALRTCGTVASMTIAAQLTVTAPVVGFA